MGYRQAVKAQHFDCCIVGSIPTSPVYGTLAQMVEHLTFNQVVGGSSPPCLTFFLFSFSFFLRRHKSLRRRILRVSNEPCTDKNGDRRCEPCSPSPCTDNLIFVSLCSYGGIGRRGRFRFCWATPVQVQVLLAALFFCPPPEAGSLVKKNQKIRPLPASRTACSASFIRHFSGLRTYDSGNFARPALRLIISNFKKFPCLCSIINNRKAVHPMWGKFSRERRAQP